MQTLSLYPDEDDESFWNEHAFVRLRSTGHIKTEPGEIISDSRIFFGSVASQDDIFEGSPPFVADPNSLNLASITELARRKMRGACDSEIDRVASRMFAELLDPRIFQERTQRLIERYGDIFRQSSILSLFRDPRVQRNWYEYAGQGAGFGAVFDFREPWPMETAPGLDVLAVPFPVEYVDAASPPVITIVAAPVDRDEGFRDIQTALLTKSDEWRTQKEERLFRMGIGPGHVDFPAASLRAMLVGYTSSDETQDLIVRLCQGRATPIPVFRMEPAPLSKRLALRRIG